MTTADIIPFDIKEAEPKCSFCKTPKSKVKRMVTSKTGKAICDKCLLTCTTILNNEKERA